MSLLVRLIPTPIPANPHPFVNSLGTWVGFFRGGVVFFNIEINIKIYNILLDQKNRPRVFNYMQDEQEVIWLKAANMKAKGLSARNKDMKYLIKMLQDELKKTKEYINSECRRPDFEYNKDINKALDWNPRRSLRFITQIKNETQT